MFDRFELLVGRDAVEKLHQKTVLLVGLGGVGGHCFESLVRSGIGNIIVVDDDVFDKTNLNRQLLSNNKNIGLLKVDEASKRAKLVNPNCDVIKINKFINKNSIDELFDYKIDFVVDAIDTIDAKKELIKKCLKEKIKFISVMGMGGKMNPNKIEITFLDKTNYDPIAKILRTGLRKDGIKDKIPVVFSSESPVVSKPIGSNSFVPAIAGLMAAGYCVNELLGDEK